MRTPDEAAVFEAAAAELAATALDGDDLSALYRVLDDRTAHPEVMFELLHLCDAAPSLDSQAAAFLDALPDLFNHAPGWASTGACRLLNDPDARLALARSVAETPRPAAEACLRRLLDEAEPDAADAFRSLSRAFRL